MSSKEACRYWANHRGCRHGNRCPYEHDAQHYKGNICKRFYERREPCKPNCYRWPFGHQWNIPGPRHFDNTKHTRREQKHRSRTPPSSTGSTNSSASIPTQVNGNEGLPIYTAEEIFDAFYKEWLQKPTKQQEDYKKKLLGVFHPDKWIRTESSQQQSKFAITITQLINDRMKP